MVLKTAHRSLALVFTFLFTTISAVEAQRLPGGVHPEHYSLVLTPDLKTATFKGEETIDVVMERPSTTITLNAAEVKFDSVTITVPKSTVISNAPMSEVKGDTRGTTTQIAQVSLDEEKQQATFTFPRGIPSGRVSLVIRYTGILNDQLRGFYLSKTKTRNYAVTQFEPTDARRAFPSFDEPAQKATYDISLVVDAGDTAISNTNIVSDTPGPITGKHIIKFATTPKMSTYLVAFLVGDFRCTDGKSEGVPIRACATPDKVELTKFAVESAKYVLHYYNDYFGIKYPMPKLDMVALPDFEAGAMENFGCITYRETDLLIDEKTASIPAKKRVAVVVAHEMAHQWFGDMVTMEWWDNLWLNEGFASWMETKPVAKWRPEWNYREDEAEDLDNTLNLDSQATTRTIRAKAETPSEINEMFDGIAYGKAGAVLGMVENFLGEEVFRQGVHNYLAAHLYANATAEDFWNAQTANSHQPVDKIMESFVTQPGVPLLTLSERKADRVPVEQSRFFLSPPAGLPSGRGEWTIPACLKSTGKPICRVLTPSEQMIPLPLDAGLPMLYINAAGKGYYRTSYTQQQYEAIATKAEAVMTPPERMGLVGDRWALVRSGQTSVGELMDLALRFKNDPSAMVMHSIVEKIGAITERIASDEDQKQLNAVLRREFQPVYTALGAPVKGESFDRQQLRANLLELLGSAEDPAVLAQAQELTNRAFAPGARRDKELDPELTDAAILVTASHGDASLYDKVMAASKETGNPDDQSDALLTLARFRDPALVTRTLDYAVSGEVRNQDSWILLAILLSQRDTRDQTWAYIGRDWEKVHAQFTTNSGNRVVAAAGSFCSVERREEVANFFAAHQVDASERTLAKAIDSIDACVRLRKEQEPKLHAWLQVEGNEAK